MPRSLTSTSLLRKVTTAAVLVLITATATSCGSKSGETSAVAETAASTAVSTDTTVALIPGDDIVGLEKFELVAPKHVTTPVSYPQSPPVGGDHNPAWQNCGVYAEPVPNESAVHSMEHGAVWIAYRPDLGAGDVAALASYAKNQTHILVSPYPGLKEKVVLSAWGRQLRLDSATDDRIGKFIVAFQNGPQTPELGAPCSGALGTPQ